MVSYWLMASIGAGRVRDQPFSTHRGVDRCKVHWPCQDANDDNWAMVHLQLKDIGLRIIYPFIHSFIQEFIRRPFKKSTNHSVVYLDKLSKDIDMKRETNKYTHTLALSYVCDVELWIWLSNGNDLLSNDNNTESTYLQVVRTRSRLLRNDHDAEPIYYCAEYRPAIRSGRMSTQQWCWSSPYRPIV